jgi:AcrR family transcriptional regulator
MPPVTADRTRKSSADASRPSARERIFAAARELFYRQGIRAVGVESIAHEAGATKMSLYRAFESKDALVAECLRDVEQGFWQWWDATTAPHADDPRAALLALFDGLAAKARTCERRGCAIGNASVEITDDAHPARAVVVAYNREKRRRLRALCRALDAREPERLADGLQLLMDGAYLSRLSLGPSGPNASLAHAAACLVDAHLS